jgi:hypothetical protein
MFKKGFIVLVLILLAVSVFGARLVDPISKPISPGNEEYVGSVPLGSTLELIFSKELGKFDSLELLSSSSAVLPKGFNYSIKEYLESIKILIEVPNNALIDSYPLKIKLSGKNTEEVIDIYFLVEENLLDVSLNNYSAESYVGEPASYALTYINNSHADVFFTVSPGLPWYWLDESGIKGNSTDSHMQEVLVSRKSTKIELVDVYPRTVGEKMFNIVVDLGNSGKQKEFSLLLKSKPTFAGKTMNIFYGIPFYSFSLIHSYDLIGLIASIFN